MGMDISIVHVRFIDVRYAKVSKQRFLSRSPPCSAAAAAAFFAFKFMDSRPQRMACPAKHNIISLSPVLPAGRPAAGDRLCRGASAIGTPLQQQQRRRRRRPHSSHSDARTQTNDNGCCISSAHSSRPKNLFFFFFTTLRAQIFLSFSASRSSSLVQIQATGRRCLEKSC